MGLADFDFLPSVPQTFWGFPPFLPPPFFYFLVQLSTYYRARGGPLFPTSRSCFYEPLPVGTYVALSYLVHIFYLAVAVAIAHNIHLGLLPSNTDLSNGDYRGTATANGNEET